MKNKRLFSLGLAVFAVVTLSSFVLTTGVFAGSTTSGPATTLVDTVRKATANFKDVKTAEAAGYTLFHGCVSGPQGGAMGIHYVNGDLVGDGELDAAHPEAVLYEAKDGALRIVGVEYIVMAEAWDAKQQAPPVLMGQMFNYVSSPNRYGLPAFYELHVWAWQGNPAGIFADFNSQVSCEKFVGATAMHETGH